MSDSFTQTTSTGWFSRIGNSFKGILVGIIAILVSFVLLWWNEGRAVETRKTLDEGAKDYTVASADKVDPALENKLVYLSGEAKGEETLRDPDFQIAAQALVLRREVEMYQWTEQSKTTTEKKLGGSEEKTTTYSYETAWKSGHVDSTKFKKPAGHE
ncbi:MAG: TMEM43 family protein, partial [Verrucomicrobiales bacterium]